jgi:hypothetical protein
MLNLKCKKEFAVDVEQYGIDFLVGNIYNAKHVNNNCYYITSESGSDVEMNQQEVKEHFTSTIF